MLKELILIFLIALTIISGVFGFYSILPILSGAALTLTIEILIETSKQQVRTSKE